MLARMALVASQTPVELFPDCLSEEIYAAFGVRARRAPRKLKLVELKSSTSRLAHIIETFDGFVTHIAGHSMICQSPGVLRLLSANGTKLDITEAGTKIDLPDNTVVRQQAAIITIQLPRGRVISQELTSQGLVQVAIDGKPIELNSDSIEIDDGVRAFGEVNRGNTLLLPDVRTQISAFGFSIESRAFDGGRSACQADLVIRGVHGVASMTRLTLHNLSLPYRYAPPLVSGSAEFGLSIRLDELKYGANLSRFVLLKDILR